MSECGKSLNVISHDARSPKPFPASITAGVILIPTKQGIASRPTGTFPPLVEQKRYVLTVLLKLVWSWHEINVLKHLASPEPVAVHGAEPNTLAQ